MDNSRLRPTMHRLLVPALGTVLYLINADPVKSQIKTLDFEVVDAQYSRGLDRVVMVSANPNQLVIYDPIAGQVTNTVVLPLPPANVSVATDGKHAAVGHNAFISYIDLSVPTLVGTYPIGCDVLQAQIGSGDYIYALPRRDQWTKIFVDQISTGQEVTPATEGGSFYAGTLGRITRDGKTLYLAQNGLSPDHMQRYDLGNGMPEYKWDWPYHGTYYTGGDLWLSEDGKRIFARSGGVFRISSVQSQDMGYNGSLTGPVMSVAHSVPLDRVFALPYIGPAYYSPNPLTQGEIDIYSYQLLGVVGRVYLPHVSNNGKSYSYFGQYIFTTNDGQNLVVIMQADNAAGFLNDYAVLTAPASASIVSAASFYMGAVAPNEIVTLLGSGLATGSGAPKSLPLPTSLYGARVFITRSLGATIAAPLFYVSPTQINFEVPPGITPGTASFRVDVNGHTVVSGTLTVTSVAPGLFAMTGTGEGPMAGVAVQAGTAGNIVTNAYILDPQQRQFVTNPIPYSNVSGALYLVLYGTGLRGAKSLVTATVGGISVPVAWSGSQSTYVGLDQVNLGPLPSGIQAYTDVPVVVSVDGQSSNAVSVRFQ